MAADLDAKNIELILGSGAVIISLMSSAISFLAKRSLNNVDNRHSDLVNSVTDLDAAVHGCRDTEGLKTELRVLERRVNVTESNIDRNEKQVLILVESIKTLTESISIDSVKRAENLGEIREEITACAMQLATFIKMKG